MQLLVTAAKRLNRGESPSSIKDRFLASAIHQVQEERFELPENPAELTQRHLKAWNAIVRIIDSPTHEMPQQSFTSSVGLDLVEDLMAGNVFAFHPSRNTVGLQSRPMDIHLSQVVGDPNSTQRKALIDTLKQFQSKL